MISPVKDEVTLKEIDKIDFYQTTAKHSNPEHDFRNISPLGQINL